MAKQYPSLNNDLSDFIKRQNIFFTASGTKDSHINLSPRSTECLRIINENTAVYHDKTGSSNETAAHMKADGRLTIMFCSFEGPPKILRLYGQGEVLHRNSEEYKTIIEKSFNSQTYPGARQIIRLNFDLVQTSCGFGVPLFDYQDDRDNLDRWAENQGPEGIKDYWQRKNLNSLDGLPTGIFDE